MVRYVERVHVAPVMAAGAAAAIRFSEQVIKETGTHTHK